MKHFSPKKGKRIKYVSFILLIIVTLQSGTGDLLIDEIDPLGHKIILYKLWYDEHIKNHENDKYPISVQIIKDIIKGPDEIWLAANPLFPEFYGRMFFHGNINGIYYIVVVKPISPQIFEVLTAFGPTGQLNYICKWTGTGKIYNILLYRRPGYIRLCP